MASLASNNDLEVLASAWRDFQTRAPVKLRTIENRRHYRAMVKLLNNFVDEIGDRESHPLMGLLDIVSFFVRDYEDRHIGMPTSEPPTALRFFMEQHNVRRADLAEIFGSQSNVSEVFSGKREINVRQAKALAARFHVSAAVFSRENGTRRLSRSPNPTMSTATKKTSRARSSEQSEKAFAYRGIRSPG